MKNKKTLLVLTMLLGILTMSMPVSAATPDAVPEPLQEQDKETEPITPDGNLTLVDDFSGKETEAKQFITLVTKDGNYFYLVIDRDDEGKETVHFLNQVDESDLLALMEDEEIESLGLEPEEGPLEEIIIEEPEEVIVEEPAEDTKNPKIPTGAIISGLIAVVGFLILAAVKLKEMKKTDRKESEKEEDEEEYYEFMDLEQEINGEGLDEEDSI